MGLKSKLDDGDKALYWILSDPIWFGEFLRSTSDGETNKNAWPKIDGEYQKFKYRGYQREFLSDKNEFILYTGGRAIGKCSPGYSRIYTIDGYKQISELKHLHSFVVYALTPELTLEQKRATVTYNGSKPCYTIITESGHEFCGTDNHPVLTPEGYKQMHMLNVGDQVAVTTYLPHISQKKALKWYELRLLGYIYLAGKWRSEYPIKPKYKKIAPELEFIADKMFMNWHKSFDNEYTFHRKRLPFRHPIRLLCQDVGIYHAIRQRNGINFISQIIKNECLDNLKVFIEAMFAQYADITPQTIKVKVNSRSLALDIQELLLRFNIETKIYKDHDQWYLELLDYRAYYRFWNTFQLPGISITNLPSPDKNQYKDDTEFMRFETIRQKYQSQKTTDTFAIHVMEDNNYISDNVFVHNSIVLEDKLVYDIVNHDEEFPTTRKSVLVTPNQAQMVPLQTNLISRFMGSKFLKTFLNNKINKSEGTMQFDVYPGNAFVFNMRIAGSKQEQNMVGLHIPRIYGDEMQIFPLGAFTQLGPTYNSWESKTQQIYCGVSNGLRNSVLYVLDQKTPRYKKYRVPAHNNPYYRKSDDEQWLREYGGEQDDRYQNLVLGRHGSASFQVIPRESITIETYAFHTFRYNSQHTYKGIKYDEQMHCPNLPDSVVKTVLAIDLGFVDPTVIQVLGQDHKGVWRTYIRYVLTRIEWTLQEEIIDWIASYYKANTIALDIGVGGQGPSVIHHLMYDDKYKHKHYDKRCIGVNFSEKLVAGYDLEGDELFQDAKSFAANELAKTIEEGKLVFSELDQEGISQIERIAKQKNLNGRDKFYVLSNKTTNNKTGAGVDENDHIFASYICFILAIRNLVDNPLTRKLGTSRGIYK